MSRVLALAGPTAAGKSALAALLHERLPIEIVSVDSTQVYRGFDIGSAKPDAAERARIAHHLLDLREPGQHYSAGDFVLDARRAIEDIQARGRVALLVGGTMLYFRALLRGMARLPTASAAIRREIDDQAALRGWSALHAELATVDPAAAAIIHPNDAQRIQRALEVYRISGEPISVWQQRTAAPVVQASGQWALVPQDRQALRRRIEARFDAMLAAGFVAEVKALRDHRHLTGAEPALRAVGYRQLWRHLAGELSLAEAREQAITASWQLARRQLTWLRSEPEWQAVDPQSIAAREHWLETVVAMTRQLR